MCFNPHEQIWALFVFNEKEISSGKRKLVRFGGGLEVKRVKDS